MRILILGGTGEARELAAKLVEAGDEVTTSLVGRTSAPNPPPGELRVGTFGGVPGLSGYLQALEFDWLIDATHPYAAQISRIAVAAAEQADVPLLRLLRAPWPEPPGGGWTQVRDFTAAAEALPPGATALITTGHDGLAELLARDDCELIVRLIEPPELPLPPHARLLLARPPYPIAGERTLFEHEGITHLVTKNAGGTQTRAKLEAAAERGTAVIVVDRPLYDPAHEVATVDEALAVLHPAA